MSNELHFAVVVGINRYPGLEKQLTTAREDAEKFACWLKHPDKGGLSKNHVSEIWVTNSDEGDYLKPSQAKPVYDNVLTSLERFHEEVEGVSVKNWRKTRLYIYVAGHGLVPPEGRGALIFANFNPMGRVEYFDLSKYHEHYEKVTPFSEVLIFADCCRQLKFGLPAATSPPFLGDRRGPTKRLLGYATEYSRMAGANVSSKYEGHGFFTTALLEGLEGEAPCDPLTGDIDSSQLQEYIEGRVPELARLNKYRQNVIILPEIPVKQRIILARREVPKFEVTARLPPDWRSEIDVALVTQAPGGPVEVKDKRRVTTERSFSVPTGLYWFVGGDIPQLLSLDGSSIRLKSDPFHVDEEWEHHVVELDRRV